MTKQATFTTTVIIWSAIGHTPITKRDGDYCDELVRTDIQCTDPDDARKQVKEMIKATASAHSGHFSMPEWWNHNTRSDFVGASELY